MERVVFLVEHSGERISCMLNPETLVVRRSAGIERQRSLTGHVTGAGLSDSPLLVTGGGRTELQLDLLFDLDLLSEPTPTTSVRRLTEQVWQLAENSTGDTPYSGPPLVRFVWGKEWNMLGVVAAVSERFERFTATGEPRRSWLRMRFVRVHDPVPTPAMPGSGAGATGAAEALQAVRDALPETVPDDILDSAELLDTHTVLGDSPDGDNLPLVAQQYYDDPDMWWLVAWFNDIVHPLQLSAGTTLLIPARSLIDSLRQWTSDNTPPSP